MADDDARASASSFCSGRHPSSGDGTKVYVAGYGAHSLPGDEEGNNYATVAYSASNGAELWSAEYNGQTGPNDDRAVGIGTNTDGTQVYVAGFSCESAGPCSDDDDATIAYISA